MKNQLQKKLYLLIFLASSILVTDECHGDEVERLVKGLSDRKERMSVAKKLANRGKSILPRMVALIESDNKSTRIGAMVVLQMIGKPAVPILAKCLRDKRVSVRRNGAFYLGLIGKDAASAAGELSLLLSDEHEWVRLCAAQALERIGCRSQSTIPRLLAGLGDDVEDVRLACAQTLATYGEEILSHLLGGLNSPNWRVRAGSIECLGRIEVPARIVVPALVPALEDENETVAGQAANSISSFEEAALPYLMKGLKLSSRRGRVLAARTFMFIGRSSVIALPDIISADLPPETKADVIDYIRARQNEIQYWVIPAVYEEEIKLFHIYSAIWLVICSFFQLAIRSPNSWHLRVVITAGPIVLAGGVGCWIALSQPWSEYFMIYPVFTPYFLPIVVMICLSFIGFGHIKALDIVIKRLHNSKKTI